MRTLWPLPREPPRQASLILARPADGPRLVPGLMPPGPDENRPSVGPELPPLDAVFFGGG